MWVVLAVVVVAGCGRFGFEERVGLPGDGAVRDGETTDAPAGCVAAPGSYQFEVGTSRYRIAGTDQWPNSEADCEEGPGTHLLVVESMAELTALLPLTGANAIWIGVTDRVTEGSFLAVTGDPPAVLPWVAGAPTAGGPDCVSWDPVSGTFLDETCGVARDRICECDGRDPVAGAY